MVWKLNIKNTSAQDRVLYGCDIVPRSRDFDVRDGIYRPESGNTSLSSSACMNNFWLSSPFPTFEPQEEMVYISFLRVALKL